MNLEIELIAQQCQLSVFDFTILSFTPRKGSFDFFFFFFLHERGFGPLGPFLFFLGFTDLEKEGHWMDWQTREEMSGNMTQK